jgi:DNA modification methylase
MTWGLTLGNCLDEATGICSLSDRSVDHVITDPPYSEYVHSRIGQEGRNDGAKGRDEITFGALTEEVARACAVQFARVAKRWILVFGDEFTTPLWRDLLIDVGCTYARTGVWVKTDAMPQMSGDRPSPGMEWITIVHAPRDRGKMRWNGGGRPAVWHSGIERDRAPGSHPTPKATVMMECLVRDFTDKGELIMDPFAGSGTTGVAAIRNGRRFLGWEMDERYHAAASRRLTGSREQLGLFEEGPIE